MEANEISEAIQPSSTTPPTAEELTRIIHPTHNLRPALRTIRRAFELLSLSYFVQVFGPVIGLKDFDVHKLEADLDNSQPDSYVPVIASKLLISLTGDRSINATNWESRLRREYLRRDPAHNPLGEEPVKLKLKLPKKAIGYAYVVEPMPFPTQSDSHLHESPGEHLTTSPNAGYPSQVSHAEPIHSSYATLEPQYQSTVPQNYLSTCTAGPSQSLPAKIQVISSESTAASTSAWGSKHDTQSAVLPNVQPHTVSILGDQSKTKEVSSDDRRTPDQQSHPHQPLSSDETPVSIAWSTLGPLIKLRALYHLCEWHLSTSHDLERFRRLIEGKAVGFGGNSSAADITDPYEWRRERCGLDSQGNQYWLCGQGLGSMLWIQRKEPQPSINTKITLKLLGRGKKTGTRGRKPKKMERFQENYHSKQSVGVPLAHPTNKRASDAAHPISKKPRPSGTRASNRLRKSQDFPDPSLASDISATIPVKKTSSSRSASKLYHSIVRTRASPRQLANSDEELWQAVPEGWLEEVVTKPTVETMGIDRTSSETKLPPSFQSTPADLSSELSEPSEEAPTIVQAFSQHDAPTPSDPSTMTKDPSPQRQTISVSPGTTLSQLTSCDLAKDSSVGSSRVVETGTEDGLSPTGICESQKNSDSTRVLAAADLTLTPQDTPPKPPYVNMGLNIVEQGVRVKAELDNSQLAHKDLIDGNKVNSEAVQDAKTSTQPLFRSTTAKQSDPHIKTEDLLDVTGSNTHSSCPEMKGHPFDTEWIEWELVCSDLEDWQRFGLQFLGTRHQDEIELVEFVEQRTLPAIVEAHEAEQKRLRRAKVAETERQRKEELMANRKRSSRLATREVLQISEATMPVETRGHSERLQAKRLKDLKTEGSRETNEENQRLVRLREREERIALREAQSALERQAELQRAERARLRNENKILGKAVKVAKQGASNGVNSTDSAEHWELNCEMCGVIGVDMDDGSEVICCDKCEKWQHLICHDKVDTILGKPRRDWNTADFICSKCSGIPVPPAVKQLRTHVNGKPKQPPKRRAPKQSNQSPQASTPENRPKSRITILMSNPDRLGGTTLDPVLPNSPRISSEQNHTPTTQLTSPGCNPHISPALAHQRVAPAASLTKSSDPSPSSVNLEMYYNDLEKLCAILRANLNLHRTLPIEVMHRLRRYLIDEQQRRHSAAFNGTVMNLSIPRPSVTPEDQQTEKSPLVTPSSTDSKIAHLNPALSSIKTKSGLSTIKGATTASYDHDTSSPLSNILMDPSLTSERVSAIQSLQNDPTPNSN